ncbi:MAG: hypothetical protein KF762_07005 [Acidobacteria bacterium]|nr:hypothetical protein [Acidobacteriota bacterium]
MRFFLMSALMMISILTLSQVIFACTCEITPGNISLRKVVRDAKIRSSVVFSGEVLEISNLTNRYGVKVAFRVESVWKGKKLEEVVVFTGKGGGDCGYPFVIGGKYLVYALQSRDGILTTNICQRTQLFSSANEDIAILGKPKIWNTKDKDSL